ncbi:unnamed protein product [Parajaminaea phylloscopi]
MATRAKDVQDFASLLETLSREAQQVAAGGISSLDPSFAAASTSTDAEPFLTLQSALLLSYTQHLLLLSSHRMLGLSLSEDANGRELVRNLVRMRLQLEKMRPIEARLKPKWERWIRASQAEEKRRINHGDSSAGKSAAAEEEDDDLDHLSFRPNAAALLDSSAASSTDRAKKASSKSSKKGASRRADDDSEEETTAGVYRPPKLAPVPYTGDRARNRRRKGDVSGSDSEGEQDQRRPPRSANTHLLSDLSTALSNNPYAEASTGLATGSGSGSGSKRAQRLREMEEYEESNFTRLVQSKKEARKRRRDEEDVALGGATTAGTGRGKVGAGFEEEFGDLLRGGERKGRGASRGQSELDDLAKKRKTLPLGERTGGKRKGKGGPAGSGNRFEKAVTSHAKRSERR